MPSRALGPAEHRQGEEELPMALSLTLLEQEIALHWGADTESSTGDDILILLWPFFFPSPSPFFPLFPSFFLSFSFFSLNPFFFLVASLLLFACFLLFASFLLLNSVSCPPD